MVPLSVFVLVPSFISGFASLPPAIGATARFPAVPVGDGASGGALSSGRRVAVLNNITR